MTDINQIRINDVQKQIKDLESQEKTLTAKLTKANRISNVTTGISMIAALIGTIFGSASLATLMFPVAFIIIPVTLICVSSTAINKVVTKKSKKEIKQLENVRNELKTLKLAYSKALDDNVITDEEYREILKK